MRALAAGARRMRDTSDLLLGAGYDAVLLLGDNQYLNGTLAAYRTSFGHQRQPP